MNKKEIINKIYFCKQNQIYILVLNFCGLRKIPKEVYKLFMITNLLLPQNDITKISKHIIKLKNLQVLNLDNNKISHINQKILNKIKFQFIWFDNNMLKKIPLIKSIIDTRYNIDIRISIKDNQIDSFNMKLYQKYDYETYYKIVITILRIQHLYKTYLFLFDFYSVY